MICKNCGAQLPDNSAFCGNCGTPQEQPAAENMLGNVPPIPTPSGGFDPNGGANPNGDFNPNGGATPNGDFNPNSGATPNGDFNPNGGATPNGDFNPNGGATPNGDFNPNSGAIPNGTFDTNKPAAQNAGGLKGFFGNKKNVTIAAVSVVALIIAAAVAVGIVNVAGSNPDKTIDRFMTAFMDQDGEAMSEEISQSYKKAAVYAFETLDYINDGAISKKTGEDMDEYVEELIVENLEDKAKYFFMEFDYELGKNYKTEYEITAEEKAEKDELEKFNEVVSRISGKDFKAGALMLADVKISGKSGSDKYEEEFAIFLCKDNSKWKVLDIYELGYDFDDLYSGLNISDIESYFK